MDITPLKAVGLTEGEIKVYLALLEIGSSTAGLVIQRSRVSSSKIYEVLERLIIKGLVSYAIQGKIKHFQACHPSRIKDYIREQEEHLKVQEDKIEHLLPSLLLKQKMAGKGQVSEIFEGVRGVKTFFELMLREFTPKGVYYNLGHPRWSSELFNAYFVDFHRRRMKIGTAMRIIYNYDAWYWKQREKRTNTFVRVLPKDLMTPTYINVYNDIVGTIFPGEEPVCFMIRNKAVADSYREYFALLWKQAEKVKYS